MSKKISYVYLFLCFSFSILPATCLSATTGIIDLGTLPGTTQSNGNGVSGDGNVAVGTAYTGNVNVDGRGFIWTQANGLQYIGGLNGGVQSNVLGVNQNGSVVVGAATNGVGGVLTAFRCTPGSPLISISPTPGLQSLANGVNGDGSVIVGQAFYNILGVFRPRAFRWTLATGAVNLGVIAGTVSSALGVSADGQVVVGSSTYGAGTLTHAFRWTQATNMQDLGALPGHNFSLARAANADGSVVVGSSSPNGPAGPFLAFKWSLATNQMVSLGILPGGEGSVARGVSADGSVIVGQADIPSGDQRAVRWGSKGIQTIEAWLAEAGVSSGVPDTFAALAVSYDGSVVVGILQSGTAFIARVNPVGSGLVAVPDLYNSLNSTTSALTLASNSTGLVLHGSHGHPLDNRIYEGCNGFWMTGDWGYFKSKTPNKERGPNALAEFGYAHLFNDYFQVGLGAGRTSSTQHLISNSRIVVNGSYFIAESITKLPCDLWATLTGYYLFGKEKIQRGYLFSGAMNSAGNPSVTTPAARARLDWENAACFHQLALSPYADLSFVRSRLNAYTEHGGSFPSSFSRRHDHSTEARVGINSSLGLGCLNLLGTIEGVHHFERTGVAANGQVLGLFAFNLPGQRVPQNWLRGSLGFKQPIMQGVFTLYLNGSTRGLDPRVWAAASYNISF